MTKVVTNLKVPNLSIITLRNMAKQIQVTVYAIGGIPQQTPITLSFPTKEIFIQEAESETIDEINSQLTYYQNPNNQSQYQLFLISETITELETSANTSGTSMIQATVLVAGITQCNLQMLFSADKPSIWPNVSGDVNSYILFKGIQYFVSETQSTLVTAANAGGGGGSSYLSDVEDADSAGALDGTEKMGIVRAGEVFETTTQDIADLGGSAFNPTTTLELYDDFVGDLGTSSVVGQLGWQFFGGELASITAEETGRIGCLSMATGDQAEESAEINLSGARSDNNLVYQVPRNCTIIFSFQLAEAANANRLVRVGIDSGEAGFFFRSDGLGNWFAVTSQDGETTTDTGVAVNTSFNQFKIITNADGTSIAFYINGVLKATHTENLLSGSAAMRFYIKTSSTDEFYISIDYFYMRIAGLDR